MRKMKLTLGVLLLAGSMGTNLAHANLPAPEGSGDGGAICGAWEWTNGTSFRRLCIDGTLHWYEYMTIKP